jgi:hypothetical protein
LPGKGHTGIEIEFEFREAIIQVILYRLVEGKFVKNINNAVKEDAPITRVGLGWILRLRNPDAEIKPTYEYKP